MPIRFSFLVLLVFGLCLNAGSLLAEEKPVQEGKRWAYSEEQFEPFWKSDVVHGEPILFVRPAKDEAAQGNTLFPIAEILEIRNAAGDVLFEEGQDYQFEPGTCEIIVPVGSRIVTSLPSDLRRPAGSQRHRLTHRDGNGEILFGPLLEYHQLQTQITYRKSEAQWPVGMPKLAEQQLPRTLEKLNSQQELSIVLLGDSISTGCNASGWGKGAPFQPAYQDLLVEHLQEHYQAKVKLTNLSVGGQSTPWGVTMIDQVVAQKPDLVLIAFGMNDSAGRSAQEYGQNTAAMIKATREKLPNCEFILIATMLGNSDWGLLKQELFPQYRDELAALAKQPGVALADMTSVWEEMLKRKKDADLTGNGVNHPNDFGHRVYAQVLSALLVK